MHPGIANTNDGMEQPGQRAATVLLEIARQITGQLDLTECLNRICEITRAALNGDRCTVMLRSERRHGLVPAADVGTPADLFERFRRNTFSLRGSPRMAQLAAGEIAVMHSGAEDPIGQQLLDDLRLSVQVIAPFTGVELPIGSLNVCYERPAQLRPEDIDLLRGIAQQAAVAIKAARLFTNAQKAAKFRTALSDLAVQLSAERDLDQVVQLVASTARAAFTVDAALLALVDRDGLTIRAAAGDGCAGLIGRTVRPERTHAASVQQFRAGRAWYVNRCSDTASAAGRLLAGLPVAAVLVAPLLIDGRPMGVLVLADFNEPDRFSEVQREEATILAATAGSWIGNSRLLAALRTEGEKLAERTERLQEANRELARKSEEVASANRALEDLIYVASHDLRAPLINLEGFVHELAGHLDDLRGRVSADDRRAFDDMQESARFIRAATTRLDVLVRGLLDVSRCGMRELAYDQVDMNALLASVVDAHRFALSSAGIVLQVGILPSVIADPVGFGQVFSNLLDNAIKYMGDAPAPSIEIGYEGGEMHRFFVRDSGAGISTRDQQRIFRLFQRGGHNGTPGEGIGLTVVRRIIERHGGAVWVESELGRGATFWFTLPKHKPHAVAAPILPETWLSS